MIDRQRLLSDLQKLLNTLDADLLERTDFTDVPEIGKTLRSEYDRARQAERTAQSYEEWKSDTVTQVAAAWVLSCVFVRFLEDNRLIDPPKIAGSNERLQRARDEHELYFRGHARETDRDYLLAVFNELSKLPGTKDVFGEHNPIRELPNWLSGDAAGELLRFFQKIDANTGTLVHDFTDSTWDTRFLGDLYQDLSEAARKKYALLQTPEFVEEFILDRTLEPALDEFGLDAAPVEDTEGKPTTRPGFRMMDPACGSGHFVLGAFRRILNRWLKQEPGAKIRDLVQRTLDSIYGVDLNPYAVAIARFRLLLASMKACSITRLAEAPAFRFNLACGDSLLHGVLTQGFLGDWSPIAHHFHSEDIDTLRRILMPGQYHAVVANPPYITPKDRALNQAYRERYRTCYRQYSLAVPFIERILQLAVDDGFTGQITASSFMNNEFGKKLIELYLPQVDLTHIVDTRFVRLAGHSTGTVILFVRNRKPISNTVRTVMGIRGERTGNHPVKGLLWTAIVSQIDYPGSQSEFISVGDLDRGLFGKHPWSIGGGGAAELKESLDSAAEATLESICEEIGFGAVTREDEVYLVTESVARRHLIKAQYIRPVVSGEEVRDWRFSKLTSGIWPYDSKTLHAQQSEGVIRFLWAYRTNLSDRVAYGLTQLDRGLTWFEYSMFFENRFRTPLSIVFAYKATHNHFVLDRGGRVFKQTAPVIKLLGNRTEDDHMAILAVLNSSICAFWEQQQHREVSAAGNERWEVRLERNSTKVGDFPLPATLPKGLGMKIDELANQFSAVSPASVVGKLERVPRKSELADYKQQWMKIRRSLISFQEELDWLSYRLYGLIDDDLTCPNMPPPLDLGQRAFEIDMARRIVDGKLDTSWFQRHGSSPSTELPNYWPDDYKRIVKRRIELIQERIPIGLIEQPEYKRRWNTEPWESQLERTLCEWLLNRLETYFDYDGRMNSKEQATAQLDIAVISIARLADLARLDADFMEVAELYCDDTAFDVHRLIAELVDAESLPLVPVLRYKDSGLRKRIEWEQSWDLQRHEDVIDARTKLSKNDLQYLNEDQARELKQQEVGDIPVPPKYTSSDFVNAHYWKLRGKLDVPKERWVSFPYCEGPDGTLVIAWAGYDHLQLAKAISTYYMDIQDRFGGRDDPRLVPLLACVIELLPWIKQWHNDPNPDFNGMRMGDYFEGFVQEEARQMGKTIAEIKAWQPPQRAKSKRKRG